MRCYYETLGVGRGVDAGALRKAYKLRCLENHPDKAAQRNEDVEKATALFREIQAAYECLCDPQERAYYDANRAAILRGSDPEEEETVFSSEKKKKTGAAKGQQQRRAAQPSSARKEEREERSDAYGISVHPYMSRTAFGDFDDEPGVPAPPAKNYVRDLYLELFALFVLLVQVALVAMSKVLVWAMARESKVAELLRRLARRLAENYPPPVRKQYPEAKAPGFFALFEAVFRNIDACERQAASINGSRYGGAPFFGSMNCPIEHVIIFYTYWTQFTSVRSFREAEPEDLRDEIMNPTRPRWERKAMELELKSYRLEARRSYDASVRRLAAYCKDRDPRVAAKKQRDEKEKQRLAEEKEQEKLRKKEALDKARRDWRGETTTTEAVASSSSPNKKKKKKKKTSARERQHDSSSSSSSDDDDDEEEGLIYTCTVCQKNFRSVQGLESHQASKIHQRKQAAFEAKEDKKSTTDNEDHVNVNARTTTAEETFDCILCAKAFSTLQALESHRQSKPHRKAIKLAQDRMRKMS